LRIELRRKTPYVVPRDVNFLALETHSQTKIVKPLDHLSSLSRSEIHNLENQYDWASPEIHRIPQQNCRPQNRLLAAAPLFHRHDSVGRLDQVVIAARSAIFGERFEVPQRLALIHTRRRFLFGLEAFQPLEDRADFVLRGRDGIAAPDLRKIHILGGRWPSDQQNKSQKIARHGCMENLA
jgi:hypothetical protein